MGIKKLSHDVESHIVEGKLNGLYYYYFDSNLMYVDGKDQTNVFVGTTDAIQNILYAPFLDIKDEDLAQIPFDNKRYGGEKGYSVFRILKKRQPQSIHIAEVNRYNVQVPRSLGIKQNFIYESKLQDYPYRTILFTSNMFESYEVKPHLMHIKDSVVRLSAVAPITASGTFQLYVDGYKEDSASGAFLERKYINSSMDIPNTSSAYSNFMSTQKARNAVNFNNTMLSANLKPWQGAIGGALGSRGIFGRLSGAITGGVGGAISGAIDKKMAIDEQVAMKQDLISTPNSLKSSGGDLLTRLGSDQTASVSAGSYEITDEYKEIIGKYFHLYGYKQSKVMEINTRSRYYFNYIKTVGANIRINRRKSIPNNYILQLQEIFDNGITLWHVDRQGVRYNDYRYENIEMSILEGRL